MKLATLLTNGLREAEAHCVPPSSLRLLLSETLQLGVAELNLHPDMELPDSTLKLWNAHLKRLLDGEPPQYICGRAWFWGLPLKVEPGILIPRPETEGLVLLVMTRAPITARILDCCTGSGAIAIAIKKFRPDLDVCASDISSEAIAIAGQNAGDLDLDISFTQCDLFPIKAEPYDLIVCNPPYITEADFETLDPVVRIHEPRLALLSGADGLDHINRILTMAAAHLNPGGLLCLEHGDTQREKIIALAESLGWQIDHAGDDLAGKPRYLILKQITEQHKQQS